MKCGKSDNVRHYLLIASDSESKEKVGGTITSRLALVLFDDGDERIK